MLAFDNAALVGCTPVAVPGHAPWSLWLLCAALCAALALLLAWKGRRPVPAV